MTSPLRLVGHVAAIALLCFSAFPTWAAEWPDRPVRIVIPFGPSGSSDRFGRLIATHLSTAFHQQFYVENKAGGAGAIGSAQVARAEPDGYTLLIAGTGPHVTGPAMNGAIGYDPIKDFVHIAMIGGDSYLFAAHPSLGVRSFAELVQRARRDPAPISAGSPGVGTIGHLMIEQLRTKAGLPTLNHVPYRGGGPLVTDLLGGHVRTAAIATVSAIEHAKVNAVVPLAVAADHRLGTLPNVPTLAELGHPDVGGATWIWLAGPANLPAPIANALNLEVRKYLKAPQAQQYFEQEALLSKDLSVTELTEFVQREGRRWKEVIERVGIAAQ